MTQELACSLKRTNPHLPFIVYAVPGELSPHVEAVVRNISELRYWNDLYFPSQRQDGRYVVNLQLLCTSMRCNGYALLKFGLIIAISGFRSTGSN